MKTNNQATTQLKTRAIAVSKLNFFCSFLIKNYFFRESLFFCRDPCEQLRIFHHYLSSSDYTVQTSFS